MLAYCEQPDIVIPWMDKTVARKQLATLVMGLDLVIVLVFVAYLLGIEHFIKRTARRFDYHTATITDFALVVHNLPKPETYKTSQQLRYLLTKHFEEVTAHEESRIEWGKEQNEKDKSNYFDIAEIHFGYNNFKKFKILLKINKFLTEGQIYQEKLRVENLWRPWVWWYNRQQDQCHKKIRKLKDKYIGLDDTVSGEIVSAYIVFRSMDGKERTERAY